MRIVHTTREIELNEKGDEKVIKEIRERERELEKCLTTIVKE